MCEELSGLNMLLLLSCWIIAGVTAKDSPTWYYRLKNSSLCLQVGISPSNTVIMWTLNKRMIVLKTEVQPNFADKVDYYPRGVLCIKNITETESGSYEVTITDDDGNISKETHILIVQDAVPTPVIRMSGVNSNLSAEFCNITVNCSVQDKWALSVCDEDSCRTSQSSFSRSFNITISAENRVIVCSGNNNVSTRNVSESIESMCFTKIHSQEKEKEMQQSTFIIVIVIVIVAAVCVPLCASIVCVAKRRFSAQHYQTSAAQVTHNQPEDAHPQHGPRESTSSSSEHEVSYENVDAAQQSWTCRSSGDELGSMQSQNAETLYSVLQGPNVTSSVGKRDSREDAKRHKKIRKASTPQSEAAQPSEIDTVYSVLQKPKNMNSEQHQ